MNTWCAYVAWMGLGLAAGVALRVAIGCHADDCGPGQVPPDVGEYVVVDAYDPILVGAEADLVARKGTEYPKLVFVITDGSQSWTTTYGTVVFY